MEKIVDYFIFSDSYKGKHEKFLGHFLHGLRLKSYEFKKYISKKETRVISINIRGIKIYLQLKFNQNLKL